MKQAIVFLCVLLCVACQPSTDKAHDHHSLANHVETAAEDQELYIIPEFEVGLMQSPINILSKRTVEGHHNVTVNFNWEINKAENLGHTVQIDFSKGNTISADDITYDTKQFHFHTPSEHLIDGITYPMEIHMVSTYQTNDEKEPVKYLVVGFLFKMGEENRMLKRVLEMIPKAAGETEDVEFDFDDHKDLMENDIDDLLQDCYHYKGSLTTPPYTESVNWYVVQKILEASPEQIRMINNLEGDNARHIQIKGERQIDVE